MSATHPQLPFPQPAVAPWERAQDPTERGWWDGLNLRAVVDVRDRKERL